MFIYVLINVYMRVHTWTHMDSQLTESQLR